MCKKRNQGPTVSFYRRFDLERVCPPDNFSEIPTNLVGDFLAMILMGSDRRNQKESIGIFFVFLPIFSGTHQIFGV
jgi:hypothetical protein